MTEKYGPPVDRLLQRPEPPILGDWPDYVAEGFGPEDVPELIRMATDPELSEGDPDSLAVWGPVHAWRTLGQLGAEAEAAVDPLFEFLEVLSEADFDDWAMEELPKVLGMIGRAALPGARTLLEQESPEEEDYVKTSAGQVLEEAGKRHPELRDECVAILSNSLERAGLNPPSTNGFLIGNLLELGAKEAAGVIERAFANELVDDSIVGTWYRVWHQLDLEGEPPPDTEPLYRLSFDGDESDEGEESDDWLRGPAEPARPREAWAPIASRTPEERKDRNKARQKLEKKLQGKNGKKKKR